MHVKNKIKRTRHGARNERKELCLLADSISAKPSHQNDQRVFQAKFEKGAKRGKNSKLPISYYNSKTHSNILITHQKC